MVAMTYKAAGVDIDAGDSLVERIKPHAKRTMRDGVLAGIGGFGALFEVPKRYREPVLVSGTDGVGTKLKLAFALNRHDTIGIDLVAMSVNDVLVQGAEPLFFLDYFATGRLNVDTAEQVIAGIARGCEQAGCALIGGETAEMPSMYAAGEYDLAGFAVGVVEKSAAISGAQIKPGDQLIGIASSGVHSNGYSLVRAIVERQFGPLEHSAAQLAKPLPGDRAKRALGEALLAPTRIYVRPVLDLIKAMPDHRVKGLAHITGGGLVGNVPRILPQHCQAVLHRSSWTMPAVLNWLQQAGSVTDSEMHRVFNCGIGMVVVVASQDCEAAMARLTAAGEQVWRVGEIAQLPAGSEPTIVI
jgi:phosphoribosylformylglycinamidine cyclo-ligase